MPTKQELDAAFKAVRELADQSGYGGWVKDVTVREYVEAALEAAEDVRD